MNYSVIFYVLLHPLFHLLFHAYSIILIRKRKKQAYNSEVTFMKALRATYGPNKLTTQVVQVMNSYTEKHRAETAPLGLSRSRGGIPLPDV